MITEPACWLPSFLILYIIQYWQQKVGDYIKDIFLQENNCNKNKVFSRCRTSNSSLPLDTEKPSSISVGKFSRHDGLREGYCFQNSCSILINYRHIKFWLSSNRKYCNPREERESAWCGCWQGTEQGSCRELQCPRNTGSIQLPASLGRSRRHRCGCHSLSLECRSFRHLWAGAREGEGHQAAIASQNVEAEQDGDSADARENNGSRVGGSGAAPREMGVRRVARKEIETGWVAPWIAGTLSNHGGRERKYDNKKASDDLMVSSMKYRKEMILFYSSATKRGKNVMKDPLNCACRPNVWGECFWCDQRLGFSQCLMSKCTPSPTPI
jgi:hypothetical protein